VRHANEDQAGLSCQLSLHSYYIACVNPAFGCPGHRRKLEHFAGLSHKTRRPASCVVPGSGHHDDALILDGAGPMMSQIQMIQFMKNVSMLGGALLIPQFGAGPFSLDARPSR
jgi:hypothetical protein